MHSIIINGDKLEIKGFKNLLWLKKSVKDLPDDFILNSLVKENAEQNGGWYFYENNEYTLYAFLAEIGVQPHPLIEFSYVSIWYNSNMGGVYVTGKDKKTDVFFAPLIT